MQQRRGDFVGRAADADREIVRATKPGARQSDFEQPGFAVRRLWPRFRVAAHIRGQRTPSTARGAGRTVSATTAQFRRGRRRGQSHRH